MEESTVENKPANNSQKRKYIFIVFGVLFVVCFIFCICVAMAYGAMSILNSLKEEGIEVPEDFEEYSADTFTIGYPTKWELSDSFGVFVTSNNNDYDENRVTTIVISENTDATKSEIQDVLDGNCSEIDEENEFEDSVNSSFQLDTEVKSQKSVTINGNSACRIEMEGKTDNSQKERDVKILAYFVVSKEDSDDTYVLLAMSSDDKNKDDFNLAKKVLRTFDVRD